MQLSCSGRNHRCLSWLHTSKYHLSLRKPEPYTHLTDISTRSVSIHGFGTVDLKEMNVSALIDAHIMLQQKDSSCCLTVIGQTINLNMCKGHLHTTNDNSECRVDNL